MVFWGMLSISFSHPLLKFLDHSPDQERNIFRTLAEGWNHNGKPHSAGKRGPA